MNLSLAARYGVFDALERADAGSLRIIAPDGAHLRFGAGGPEAEIAIRDWRTLPALLARGDIGFGEAYAEGWWESPDLETLFAFGLNNQHALGAMLRGSPWSRWRYALQDALLRDNSHRGAQRNIHAHYDLGNAFYTLWLDESMTYSSALYHAPNEDLSAAQQRKYDRLLAAAPGARVLEIGCGWGGFAARAAERGRDVTAITISPAQQEYAARRLGARAEIRLLDYRDVAGRFDAIVSIEMIEAVGERRWPVYFRALKRALAENGRAALQAIVVRDETFHAYKTRSDFIRRNIFPGGMLLTPGRIRSEAARAGLAAENAFHLDRKSV
ncbi:MAG: class I SAM-dependent methyltransferase, partial [Hyphomonadaceae bacterium]